MYLLIVGSALFFSGISQENQEWLPACTGMTGLLIRLTVFTKTNLSFVVLARILGGIISLGKIYKDLKSLHEVFLS